jgi:predicted cupin superfamily sugar epimerase
MMDGTSSDLDMPAVIRLLALQRHPEGGWYRETWRHEDPDGHRGAGTAIYYLLGAGEVSAWHRVDATEIWHWYAGAPLRLDLAASTGPIGYNRLGRDLLAGERPQIIAPAGIWQSAQSLGAWSLVGCTVSPAFEFSGFEMAAPGWQPSK